MDADKMKNHRYHFLNEDYIVSPEEHQYVLNSLKAGRTQVILRDGNLIMNLALGFSAVETDHLTAEQEKVKNDTLQLGGKKWEPPTPEEIARRKKMVEGWKEKNVAQPF